MLMRLTGRVDCFGCVCVPSRLSDKVLRVDDDELMLNVLRCQLTY